MYLKEMQREKFCHLFSMLKIINENQGIMKIMGREWEGNSSVKKESVEEIILNFKEAR